MKPDKSQLEHWKRDHTTIYIMTRLKEQFRALESHQAAISWEDYKMRVGQQQVIHAINRICGGD